MFIDELEIHVEAGNGGNGALSFRREKYVEFGGPDGGDGGNGGSVIVKVRPEFNTLLPLRNRRKYKAGHGRNGRGDNMTGATGENLILEVPAGTIVRDRESGTILGDLTLADSSVIVAKGGRGGKGNRHFVSSTHQAPKFAQPGEEGETLWLRLELKVLADVGLVGFPNAGKSTFISRISAAKPKVADYPFTTLKPNLGVVRATPVENFVVADIPGIIEGAHEGAGLGLRFLKHIERTSILLVMIDPADPEREPDVCYRVLRNELNSFSTKLSRKPHLVAFTKADVPHERQEAIARLTETLRQAGIHWATLSSVTGEGIQAMVYELNDRVKEAKAARAAEMPAVSDEEGPAPEKVGESACEEEAQTSAPDHEEIDPLDELDF
ncbi:GTPase ObgE [Sulfidibacter corallicola]|uniref:GTPase Obg n=1 Tax=Sulfidibacter corallicola TaxID=2818388 RepID=A0A8A4TVR5_SULCO|nr:GTPase ObgE [Sulfidibacter corallicola]QTD53258.1 GTPase ObgE [Sulfidibacter corallicola]